MSKENRKKMYDKLVSEKRFNEIDSLLIKEFGNPIKVEPKKESKKNKKVKKNAA